MCLKFIILVTNFQKSPSAGRFNFGELKLRNIAKLRFFNQIMMKSNLKNHL